MMHDWFGNNEFVDKGDLIKLVSRAALDLLCVWLVASGIYARLYRDRRDYVFTYYLLNLITFSMCALLRKVPMELGFALGLFAVFGILRYRTEPIRMRDLTYLFVVIGLAILNAVANKKISFVEMIAVDALIVGATAVIELAPRHRVHGETPVLYDNLGLLQPGREQELYADLAARTGLPVVAVRIHRIDLLRDAAEITAIHGDRPIQHRKP